MTAKTHGSSSETPVMSDQERRIVSAAQRLFIEKGYSGTSMSDIAAEAGINRSALHYYFRTKEKMFQAVFGDIIASVVPAVHDVIVSDLPFPERLEKIVDMYMGIFIENPGLPSFVIRELARDSAHLVSTAKSLGIAEYGCRIVEDLTSEMDSGSLRRVPLDTVFNTFYGLLLFPFLSGGLFFRIFPGGTSCACLDDWKHNIVSQMSHLLLP